MKKIIKRASVSFLIVVFSLAPISPQSFTNFQQVQFAQATDIKDVDLNNIVENVLIPHGTKFVIEKGTTLNFNDQYLDFVVEGELEINGTKDEPVVIKRSNYMNSFSIITK
ncbi:MAG TPA: hypothetical protein DEA46_05940, partial [Candidatus Moranbacteria bacterium]|nr:hypothetical protein [Candidatus Moranbacteria bacterium]